MNAYINKYKGRTLRELLFYIVVFILCAIILCKPEYSAGGAKKGIVFCVDVLVPSLFPFMVISSFIVNTGTAEKLAPFFSKVTNKLFNLPGCTGSTILISLIGGYPTGARGISSLLNNGNITEEQARRMLMFCVGAGPAFVISAIGATMLNNIYVGLAIFISQVISSIILGIISSRISKGANINNNTYKSRRMTFSQALVVSCEEAAKGIISICAFVVLFSSFLAIIETSAFHRYMLCLFKIINLQPYLQGSILSIIFEVTGASYKLTDLHAPVELLAFALGFGGLAVHFQIFSCVDSLTFSKLKFLLFRVMQGLISSIIVHYLIYFVPVKQTVTVFNFCNSRVMYHNIAPSSFALILLCCCFILTITPKTINFSSKKRGFSNDKRRFKGFKKKC